MGQDAQVASLFAVRGKMTDEATETALEIKDEQRQAAEAKAAGKPAPTFAWHPELGASGPGYLWNAMIAPLTGFPIRGAIWYQGETNAGGERFPYYDRVMRDLIEDWRQEWGVGAFPSTTCNWPTGSRVRSRTGPTCGTSR